MNTAILSPRVIQRWRATPQRTHPGWWTWLAAAAAWTALLVWHFARRSPTMMPGHHRHSLPADVGAVSWALLWTGMIVAMMWPLWSAAVAAVSRASYPRWRFAMVSTYVATLTGLWLVAGLAARSIHDRFGLGGHAAQWAAAWLLVAAMATLSTRRSRLLRACGRLGVIAPGGRRGLGRAAVLAMREWPRCAALCGPVMVAMISGHVLVPMIAGSAALWWERRHPRAWHDPVPVALLVGAAALTALV